MPFHLGLCSSSVVRRLPVYSSKLGFSNFWRSSSTATRTRLHADLCSPLVDEPTKYSVTGLKADQDVTIAAILQEGSGTFVSHAHYRANQEGVIDLKAQASTGGTYTGIKPMGLLWSMKPEEGSRTGLRLSTKDVTSPFMYKFHLLSGHQVIGKASDVEKYEILCSMDHSRSYLGPGVKRIPVREGKLRGALFLPQGEGPFPGVIDLFGTVGGLTEFRSALLASRGFASFALAYFAYDDLPSNLSLDMEYFEEAVDWFSSHPMVKEGIGTIGVSKGTELITYMAIYSSLIKAVVCINGCHYYSVAEHYKNGEEQSVGSVSWEHIEIGPEGLHFDDAVWHADIPEESVIRLEEAKNANFLFINGEDDRCCKNGHTDMMVERLKRHGKSNYEVARYPGAGHLIEPPFTPHSRTAYHKAVGTLMLFGGQTESHAHAQEDSWHRILEFFRVKL